MFEESFKIDFKKNKNQHYMYENFKDNNKL